MVIYLSCKMGYAFLLSNQLGFSLKELELQGQWLQ